MASHENYILKVTAGPSYNPSTHSDVHVNSSKPISISSEHLDAHIHVRIKDFRGLPKDSPTTSPYFSHPKHTYDRYSISFSFTPKKSLQGDQVVFGNDFDHPIRDRLPPLFDKAFGVVKWWIDPGLDGDVLADEPYLYGALLSSINTLRVGGKDGASSAETQKVDGEEVVIYEEGGEGDGEEVRKEKGVPGDARQRQKWFLTEQKRKDWTFEEGRTYMCDFFNPYLDFNEFALKLGYGLPAISIVSHWDGQPLRYVLKDRSSNTELFVIVFQLLPTEEAKKEGAEDPEEKFEEVHKGEAAGASKNDDDDVD